MTQQTAGGVPGSALLRCGQALNQLAMDAVREGSGRIRVEDAICVLATIVAERCIDAAAELSLRDHALTPGQRVFSEKINQLLVGSAPPANAAALPADSVFGFLFRSAGEAYPPAAYPDPTAVVQGFAARIGDPADWGKVPLSVPPVHAPSLLPIRVGYETRGAVDKLVASFSLSRQQAVLAAVIGLSLLLKMAKGAIDPKVALLLSAEIINGMAKTAPMTEKAMAAIAAQQKGRTG